MEISIRPATEADARAVVGQGPGGLVVGTLRKHAFVRGEYIDEVLAEKFINESAEGMT